MATLVSIISEQPIPNLLFILEKKSEINKHIFITTRLSEERGIADRLIRLGGIAEDDVKKVEVIEDSLRDIYEKLSAANLPSKEHYVLNLTGGTKIMTLGVSRFFEKYNPESFYTPINKNLYKRITPFEQDGEVFPFRYSLNLRGYLSAFGFEVEKEGLAPWITNDLASRIYNLNGSPSNQFLLNSLRASRRNYTPSSGVVSGSLISQVYKRIKWPVEKTAKTIEENLNFLISGWWEAYAYYRIKKDLNLELDSIFASCVINRGGKINNEFDVVFVYNNRLFVIECKTGFERRKFTDEFNKTVYKLAALRRELGLKITAFLFILDPNLRHDGLIKVPLQSRAEIMDTILVDRKTLDDRSEWQKILNLIKKTS